MPRILKTFFILLIGIWGFFGAFRHETFSFLSGVNLLFHEAGHPLFGGFGEFAGILGGTLMQLLIPVIVTIYFFKQENPYAAGFGFFWIASNFFDISVYVKDAREQVLPYVGGEIHDWNYLLSYFNLLTYERNIAGIFWIVGFGFLIAAILLGFYSTFRETQSEP